MHFKIDENLPVEVADLLIAAGHSAHTVFYKPSNRDVRRQIYHQAL